MRGTEFKHSELKKYIYNFKTESLSPSFILFSTVKPFRGCGTHVPSVRGGGSLRADKWPPCTHVFNNHVIKRNVREQSLNLTFVTAAICPQISRTLPMSLPLTFLLEAAV